VQDNSTNELPSTRSPAEDRARRLLGGSRKRILSSIAAVFALTIVVGVVSLLLLEPRSDRTWAPELEKTSFATTEAGGAIRLHNVRDWTYGLGEIKAKGWREAITVDPAKITRAWFMFEPFPALKPAGHTYLTFEFSDGSAISFSVEARKEAHEKFRVSMGLFRQYELAYTWGTERDFLTRRLMYLQHPLYMYPLAIETESAQRYFRMLVEKTNQLAEHPRFYNTLTANCTNLLAEIANESAPGAVPYDISWNFPGFSDLFLMRIGLIEAVGTREETQAAFDLTPFLSEIEGFSQDDAAVFSRELRQLAPLKKQA
jgi:hypothetical protein